ncbi:hypothetical protein BpHYR1_014756 [Brachionus plicatilis]|uniref:Uncharacterized protein n=1 Tax=Brachionus plicatilis TaxID=10195 RepID=A0A3M7RFP0_BRAPC|nr:hypothetical protein BpHYR1_014756 [Brachionus plicatilis]
MDLMDGWDFICVIDFSFKDERYWGYHEFKKINEIMNSINGYYDANEDSITTFAKIRKLFLFFNR